MNWLLYPFSKLYGTAVWMRNKSFDNDWKKSVEFEIPIIVVGNLRVGGTGKTPHTEWLINHLKDEFKIGVLSRGYGRRTIGFRWVSENDRATDVGDEPLQMKKKFNNIPIAVCGERVEAVPLMVDEYNLNLIILDDAFQHRYIKPTFTIVLSAADKPFFNDQLLPLGRLRESGEALKRADAFIYTKCSRKDLEQREMFINEVKKYNPQLPVFFSTYQNNVLKKVIGNEEAIDNSSQVIVVTALADPDSLVKEIGKQYKIVKHFNYSDHHYFTSADINSWKAEIKKSGITSLPIITSEKDSMRLLLMKNEMDNLNIYYLPVEPVIEESDLLISLMKKRIKEFQQDISIE